MKPCWYINPLGKKCGNEGIVLNVINDLILTEIAKYKDNFITDFEYDDNNIKHLYTLISEKETLLAKQKRALKLVNDAYGMGDYDREEWLERKKKRELELSQTTNEIYELNKCMRSDKKISNAGRLKTLSDFFDNINTVEDNAAMNDLYRTKLESIIWYKEGKTIRIAINFK